MDKQEGHQFFSADCFNQVWGLLDKTDRTKDEDRLMRETAHASLFHWLQRVDVDPGKISVGLWQVSRVHAVLGDATAAMNYAQECVEISDANSLPAFYRGYAYEASARAAKVLGRSEEQAGSLAQAEAMLGEIEDAEEKGMLEKDLADLRE